LKQPVRLPLAVSSPLAGGFEGKVMFIDRFGNALTNIRQADLAAAFPGVDESTLQISVVARTIDGIARSYGDHQVGALVALMGSSGRLEIAMVGGDVAVRFGIGEGDPVRIRRR
jgi:S-adenosylmethionine hydrolase